MKNTNRVRKNTPTKLALLQVKTQLIDPLDSQTVNRICEPELRVLAANWSAKKRIRCAKKMARWVSQLLESAEKLQVLEAINKN